MLKDEFIEEIKSEDDRIDVSIWTSRAYIKHKKKGFRGFSHDGMKIDLETKTKFTKTNLEKIKKMIRENKEKIDEWHENWKKYSKTSEYIERKRKDEMKKLALETDLKHKPGSYDRGDYYYLRVVDFVYKKKDLGKYDAHGDLFGLVRQTRKRVYAKSSKWSNSEKDSKYIVGRKENGDPFAHPVPKHIDNLHEAVNWIWDGEEIEKRQGKIGLTDAPHLKDPSSSEQDKIKITGTQYVEGEIYQNGAIYCRNARIYDYEEEHKDLEVEEGWKRILVAKESDNDVVKVRK